MITAFLSYSHRDEQFRNELEAHLTMLKREGLIDLWHDRRILAGTDIDEAVTEGLESAQLVLLLVSPYFLASSYCYEREMERALGRHRLGEARVIPIILRPCDWKHSPLGRLRATPPDGRPITKFPDVHEAFQLVVDDIHAALAELGAPPAGALNPPPAVAPPPIGRARPRSSNLRVRREFSEKEQDEFLEDSFSYIANFFEASLNELTERNASIEARCRRIDSTHFTAAIYRNGKKEAACRVWTGGAHMSGIMYAASDRGSDNSYNECLSP
jgi:hypothetical protein